MGCYKVLSSPISSVAPYNYKGVYRSEPFPQLNVDSRMLFLWEKYTQYGESLINMGITTELTLDELKELADLFTQADGQDYEVVLLSESFVEHPFNANYYGIDVAGLGGYSILGEGLFNRTKKYFDVINRYFRTKLNPYYLFDTLKDASDFQEILFELGQFPMGIVEREDWHIVHVFKIA